MTDGPWPKIDVNGKLEHAEKEWLHTNGAGAYAMSTIAMMHTRRYHGVLIAALDPPTNRCAILSHAETTVRSGRRSYRLSTHQFPGVAPTPGYRMLESFSQDPLPRWTYRLGRARLERTLCLVRGQNAVVLAHEWHGQSPARLFIRPLLAMRDMRSLTHEHGAMIQRVAMRPGAVEIQPVDALPEVVFGHDGVFVGSPDWYRRFEYAEDRERDVEAEEDLWTPGHFELELEPRKTTYMVAAVGDLPERPSEELVRDTKSFLLDLDPGVDESMSVRRLTIAAEQFRADACERPAIIAGYPWHEAETRDLLISMPGLYFALGRNDEAKRVLRNVLANRVDSLLPRRVPATKQEATLSADASLWLFETARLLAGEVGTDDPFVREELYSALVEVFERVRGRKRTILWLAKDGLVLNGVADVALTWMDARAPDGLATPRRGLAVELQGLWSKGCETLAAMAHHYGDTKIARAAESACEATRAAFARRFWCARTKYPYDCIRDPEDAGGSLADASIRPNALIALDVDPRLFERWQAEAIVENVARKLLTPRGVRSLDQDDPAYRGEYAGGYDERRAAYHQGLAWTHLIGAYARAALRLQPDDFDLQEELRHLVERVQEDQLVVGQLSQLADGEAPFKAGGCPAQAWSVAELLRTLSWNLNR